MKRTLLVLCSLALVSFSSFAQSEIGESRLKVEKAEGPRFQYARSFRTTDGTIYLLGPFKTANAGKSLTLCASSDPPWAMLLREPAMNTLYSRKGLFFALKNKVVCAPGGECVGKIWRSTDDLKSFHESETRVVIPEAGKVDNGADKEWAGLFFHRAVVELRDGSLLAAMYGNFEQDTTAPTNPRSKEETKYKLRAFTVRSTDVGATWRYLATVAAPDPNVVDETEGINEWSMARLADGRLLGILRTGHYSPMLASWSSDEGKTWTAPIHPEGLGPGADPFVLRLSDGRLALAHGEIVQPKGPKEAYWKNYREHVDNRRRCMLALNADGSGRSWKSYAVSDYSQTSAYATIFEVEPNTVVYQADLNVWRVELPPKQ